MKNPISFFLVAVFCVAFQFGDAQDSGQVPFQTQGNVSQNLTSYEAEMDRAAKAARRQKELKASAASTSFAPPPPVTTAEEYLKRNPPPVSAPPVNRPPVERGYPNEVPEFDRPVVRRSNARKSLPKREGNFLDWLKGKKENQTSTGLLPVGSSEYENNPYEDPETPVDPIPESSSSVAEPVLEPSVEATPISEVAVVREVPTPPESQGVEPIAPPTPPPSVTVAEAAPVVSAPEPEPAAPSIFQKRGQRGGGESATVSNDVDVSINGVNVKLFAGTQVTVLSKTFTDARVRLPDGREALVKRRSLTF